jgi:Heterokaryon incompatibility protein (HET)
MGKGDGLKGKHTQCITSTTTTQNARLPIREERTVTAKRLRLWVRRHCLRSCPRSMGPVIFAISNLFSGLEFALGVGLARKGKVVRQRSINTNNNNEVLKNSWLDLCQDKHKGPCIVQNVESARKFRKIISPPCFGVIGVRNMQLTELPLQECYSEIPRHPGQERAVYISPAPYAALSYVWEKPKGPEEPEEPRTAILENIMALRTHDGLEKILPNLPLVIREVLDPVRGVGLKYIWINALCIVQDSPRSWELNAYNMDLICGILH